MKSKIKLFNFVIASVVILLGISGCKAEIKYVDKEVIIEVEKPVYITAIPEGTYTVYHVLQNVTGGNALADYTLFETENSKELAEKATITDLNKTYTGFSSVAMAHNGNVIYIFYDRNVITYTFQTGTEGKLTDGTTEKIVSGLYGAQVPVPIATSSTHNFCGWFTSDNEPLEPNFCERNLTFTVKWKEKSANDFNWYETPIDVTSGEIATTASEYIYFGVFPKTVLPYDSAISIDETEKITMGANTYYKGNDGNWYAKVTATPYNRDYKYSDETTVFYGDIRYFKVEPVKWRVLTTDYNGTGKALLLAEDTLTANVPYYVDWGDRKINNNTIYANNYKYSLIRAYLNGKYESDDVQDKTAYTDKGFLQTAFTSNAQLLIADTLIDNSSESTTDENNEIVIAEKYACENTTDKIFLLSVKEATTSSYGFSTVYLHSTALIRTPTDYALANYADRYYSDNIYSGYWWLRSPYDNIGNTGTFYAHSIGISGSASSADRVDREDAGIVPALTISLQ